MNEQQVFILADQALAGVIAQIKDEQWSMKMPPEFRTRDKKDSVTLKEIVNYHAYDDAWVPDILAGKTMAEAGETKFDGDLLGDDPIGQFAAIVEKAIAAARALDDPERKTHLTYGDFPAREYLQHITSFRGFRAHDIAKLIGVDSELGDDLVDGMWDMFVPHVEEWRKMGVFGPEVEVPETASKQDKLLGLVGRQP